MERADTAWLNAKTLIEQKGKTRIMGGDITFEVLSAQICFGMRYPMALSDHVEWNKVVNNSLLYVSFFEKTKKEATVKSLANNREATVLLHNKLTAGEIGIHWLLRNDCIHTIVDYWGLDLRNLSLAMFKNTLATMEMASGLPDPVEMGTCYLNIGSFIAREDMLAPRHPYFLDPPIEYYPWDLWKWPAIKQKLVRIPELEPIEAVQEMIVLSGGTT